MPKSPARRPSTSRPRLPTASSILPSRPQEMDEFVYVPDFNVVLSQQDVWSERWENEIAPLL